MYVSVPEPATRTTNAVEHIISRFRPSSTPGVFLAARTHHGQGAFTVSPQPEARVGVGARRSAQRDGAPSLASSFSRVCAATRARPPARDCIQNESLAMARVAAPVALLPPRVGQQLDRKPAGAVPHTCARPLLFLERGFWKCVVEPLPLTPAHTFFTAFLPLLFFLGYQERGRGWVLVWPN